jgi:hypothetical protein
MGRKKRQKAPAKQMAARTQRSFLNDPQQPVVCLDEKVRPFSARPTEVSDPLYFS